MNKGIPNEVFYFCIIYGRNEAIFDKLRIKNDVINAISIFSNLY